MKFLQIFILAVYSSFVFAGNPNDFESSMAGFKVTKPTTWKFITVDENLENVKKTKKNKLNDTEFKQYMLKYSTVPLVAIMKHPEHFDDLNPTFRVNIKPLGNLDGADPKQMLNLILPRFKTLFQDFNLVQPPMDTKVSGLNAAYMRMNYSLMIPDGRKFLTASELWIVPRGEFFFMIGAGTRQDEKTGSRKDIYKILSSVVLSK